MTSVKYHIHLGSTSISIVFQYFVIFSVFINFPIFEIKKVTNFRARSTDCSKLTANQRFITVISSLILSQSKGLGKMALMIVEYAYDRSFQLIGVIWLGPRQLTMTN